MTEKTEKCEVCGRLVKNRRETSGLMCCAMCNNLVHNVNKRPDLVKKLMREVHGENELPVNQDSAQRRDDDRLREELESIRIALEADSGESLTAVADRRMAMLKKLDQLYIQQDDELQETKAALDAVQPPSRATSIDIPEGYLPLALVFSEALQQAAWGKGRERHVTAPLPFEQQKSCSIARSVGLGYPIGQAVKKAEESLILADRGPAELLGAINYLAMAHIVMTEQIENEKSRSIEVQ